MDLVSFTGMIDEFLHVHSSVGFAVDCQSGSSVALCCIMRVKVIILCHCQNSVCEEIIHYAYCWCIYLPTWYSKPCHAFLLLSSHLDFLDFKCLNKSFSHSFIEGEDENWTQSSFLEDFLILKLLYWDYCNNWIGLLGIFIFVHPFYYTSSHPKNIS